MGNSDPARAICLGGLPRRCEASLVAVSGKKDAKLFCLGLEESSEGSAMTPEWWASALTWVTVVAGSVVAVTAVAYAIVSYLDRPGRL